MPCYVKSHPLGEYVFDHGWADAYERAGGRYYPKLQAFGPLHARHRQAAPRARADANRKSTRRSCCRPPCKSPTGSVSSLHITFPTRDEWPLAGEISLLQRTDQQFHWRNDGFRTFDDFLEVLASRKRKAIRRERREALEDGIAIEWVTGSDLTEAHFDAFFAFYIDTGSRKWGRPI